MADHVQGDHRASSAEPTLPLEARNLERVAELQQLGRKKLETAAAEAGIYDKSIFDGWRIEVKFRKSGNSKGDFDLYYFDAEGRRFRSQKEAVSVLATTLNMPGFGEADSDYDETGDPRRKRAKVDGAVAAAGPDVQLPMRTARLKAPNYRAMLNSSIYGDDSPVHAVPGVPHMQYNASAGYGSGDDGSAGGEEQEEEEEGYEEVYAGQQEQQRQPQQQPSALGPAGLDMLAELAAFAGVGSAAGTPASTQLPQHQQQLREELRKSTSEGVLALQAVRPAGFPGRASGGAKPSSKSTPPPPSQQQQQKQPKLVQAPAMSAPAPEAGGMQHTPLAQPQVISAANTSKPVLSMLQRMREKRAAAGLSAPAPTVAAAAAAAATSTLPGNSGMHTNSGAGRLAGLGQQQQPCAGAAPSMPAAVTAAAGTAKVAAPRRPTPPPAGHSLPQSPTKFKTSPLTSALMGGGGGSGSYPAAVGAPGQPAAGSYSATGLAAAQRLKIRMRSKVEPGQGLVTGLTAHGVDVAGRAADGPTRPLQAAHVSRQPSIETAAAAAGGGAAAGGSSMQAGALYGGDASPMADMQGGGGLGGSGTGPKRVRIRAPKEPVYPTAARFTAAAPDLDDGASVSSSLNYSVALLQTSVPHLKRWAHIMRSMQQQGLGSANLSHSMSAVSQVEAALENLEKLQGRLPQAPLEQDGMAMHQDQDQSQVQDLDQQDRGYYADPASMDGAAAAAGGGGGYGSGSQCADAGVGGGVHHFSNGRAGGSGGDARAGYGPGQHRLRDDSALMAAAAVMSGVAAGNGAMHNGWGEHGIPEILLSAEALPDDMAH